MGSSFHGGKVCRNVNANTMVQGHRSFDGSRRCNNSNAEFRVLYAIMQHACHVHCRLRNLAPWLLLVVIHAPKPQALNPPLAGVSGAGRSAKESNLYCEIAEGINSYSVRGWASGWLKSKFQGQAHPEQVLTLLCGARGGVAFLSSYHLFLFFFLKPRHHNRATPPSCSPSSHKLNAATCS